MSSIKIEGYFIKFKHVLSGQSNDEIVLQFSFDEIYYYFVSC